MSKSECIGIRWELEKDWNHGFSRVMYRELDHLMKIQRDRYYPVIVIRKSELEKKATEWEEDAKIDRENGDFKWAADKMSIVSELRFLIPLTKEREVRE